MEDNIVCNTVLHTRCISWGGGYAFVFHKRWFYQLYIDGNSATVCEKSGTISAHSDLDLQGVQMHDFAQQSIFQQSYVTPYYENEFDFVF